MIIPVTTELITQGVKDHTEWVWWLPFAFSQARGNAACHLWEPWLDLSLLNTAALHIARGYECKGNRNPTFKVLMRSRGKMGPRKIKRSLKTKMTCPYTHILVDNHLQPRRDWGRGCMILLESLRRHLARFLEEGGFRAEESPPWSGSWSSFFPCLVSPVPSKQ